MTSALATRTCHLTRIYARGGNFGSLQAGHRRRFQATKRRFSPSRTVDCGCSTPHMRTVSRFPPACHARDVPRRAPRQKWIYHRIY